MRNKHFFLGLPILIILLVTIACNLPGLSVPTPFLTPTPDLTLTAIFYVVPTIAAPTEVLPTAPPTTTQAILLTSTPIPTYTPIPPTATFPPIMPTSTTKPTDTPVSYAGPDKRSGPSIQAYYLRNEPRIDGVFDDWDLDKYTISNVVYGANRWSGLDDLSAKAMFGWDDNYLYVAARVFDDEYVQGATGRNLFKGDSIEILLDTKVARDYYFDTLSLDDYQLGISAGNPNPGVGTEAYLWYPQGKEDSQNKVKIGVVGIEEGYRIEVKIPWAIYEIKPDIGQHYGFVFSVSDNDRAGENVQQSMVSSVSTRVLADPTTWGDLVLMGQP